MHKAFVMIRCDTGKEDSVIANLLQITDVKDAFGAFGAYDIIVTVYSETQKKVEDIISKQIRKLNHVRGTFTIFTDKHSFDKVTSEQEKETLDRHTAQAFVLIEFEHSKQRDIINQLRKVPEIIEGSTVIGTYDVIVKVAAPSYNEVSDIVTKKIRIIPGIKNTLTLNIIMEQSILEVNHVKV